MKPPKSVPVALVLSLAFSAGAFAGPTDVKPASLFPGSHYVRVTKKNDVVSFDDCVFASAANPCASARPLGKSRYYTLDQLRSQRATEAWQAAGAVAADVVIVAGGILGGVAGGLGVASLAGYATGGFEMVGLAVAFGAPGMAVGGAGAGYLVSAVDALNPATQIRQVGAIGEDVIQDRDVKTKNVSKFIKRLELVLEKIDG